MDKLNENIRPDTPQQSPKESESLEIAEDEDLIF